MSPYPLHLQSPAESEAPGQIEDALVRGLRARWPQHRFRYLAMRVRGQRTQVSVVWDAIGLAERDVVDVLTELLDAGAIREMRSQAGQVRIELNTESSLHAAAWIAWADTMLMPPPYRPGQSATAHAGPFEWNCASFRVGAAVGEPVTVGFTVEGSFSPNCGHGHFETKDEPTQLEWLLQWLREDMAAWAQGRRFPYRNPPWGRRRP